MEKRLVCIFAAIKEGAACQKREARILKSRLEKWRGNHGKNQKSLFDTEPHYAVGKVDFTKYDRVCSSFIALPTGNTIWRIFFIPAVRRDTDCGYRVDIDSKTGEPLKVLHQYAYDSDWASWYE